jgi:predicted XRE-type DNA-binding protein
MDSTTTTTSWNNAKDEVSSWIENEQACVTAQRIAQTLGLSRKEASLLLKEILQEKGKDCQITTCHRVQKEGVTGES